MSMRRRAAVMVVLLVAAGAGVSSARASGGYHPELDDPAALRAEIYRMVVQDPALVIKRVEETLFSYLDRPENMKLSIVPETDAKLLAGGFKELTFSFENSVVKDLKIRRAFVHVTDCVVDFEQMLVHEKFRFKEQGKVDLLLTVTEEDLNDVMRRKTSSRKVRNGRLDFRPGQVRFTGGIKLLFFNNQVRVAGRISVRNGNELYFSPQWMNLDFLPIPPFVLRAVSRRMNPVATLEKLKFSADLTIIETTRDSMYVATESMRSEVERLIAEEASRSADAPDEGEPSPAVAGDEP